METLVRSTTATFIRRRSNGYEQLNPFNYEPTSTTTTAAAPDDNIPSFPSTPTKRTPSSTRRRIQTKFDPHAPAKPARATVVMAWSPGYRITRARQRQIFLRSYQLASGSKLERRNSRTRKLKKVAVKVRMVVASLVVSFVKFGGGLRSSCSSKAATATCVAASPIKISRFC